MIIDVFGAERRMKIYQSWGNTWSYFAENGTQDGDMKTARGWYYKTLGMFFFI